MNFERRANVLRSLDGEYEIHRIAGHYAAWKMRPVEDWGPIHIDNADLVDGAKNICELNRKYGGAP